MNFRQSAIWKDVFKILNQKKINHPVGDWKGVVHSEVGNIIPIKITEIVIEKDFINEVTEKITVSFLIDKGTYLSKIYPNLENLEMTLSRYGITGQPHHAPAPCDFKRRYKVIFLDKYNYKPKGTKEQMVSLTGAELLGTITVNFQLMNLNVEPLRLRFIHGTYLNHTPTQILHTVIPASINIITLASGPCIDEYKIVEPDNKKPIKNLVVPSDTNILDFPLWLHQNMMGVYNSGLGTFVTHDSSGSAVYHVYPTYKPNPFTSNLLLYALPDTELNYNESTFKKTGNTYQILTHIRNSYIENKQVQELKNGTGFRIAASHYFMQGYPNKVIKVTEKGPLGEYEKNNYKVVTKSRKDGFNLAVRQKELSTANPFKYYSDYVANIGNYVFLNWQQSDFTVLEPCMKTTINALYGNTVNKEDGILAGFTTVIQMRGKGILDQSGYTETTILKVRV